MFLLLGVSGKLIPKNYKGAAKNYLESIPLAKFPTCAWSGDAYINWLTQNAINNVTRITSTIASLGIAAAGVSAMPVVSSSAKAASDVQMSSANAGIGAVSSIGSLIGDFKQASMLPNVEQGQNTADVIFSSGKNDFMFYHMRCKLESWKIIDDYFSRYGYKIMRVKVPEISSRTYWNYIQIGSGESFGRGNIPQTDLEIINSIAQRGFTVWHSHDNIGNYTLTNSIVS